MAIIFGWKKTLLSLIFFVRFVFTFRRNIFQTLTMSKKNIHLGTSEKYTKIQNANQIIQIK